MTSCPASAPCGSCCDEYESGSDCAGGSNTYSCAGLSQPDCETIPTSYCCRWTGTCNARPCTSALGKVIPGHCAFCGCNYTTGCSKKACGSLGVGDCATCGCTPSGTCPKNACSSLSEGNCASCTGCGKVGTCTARTCAGVAAISNHPDVCAGCNTCAGTWAMTDARGALPWTVYTTAFSFNSAGSVGITSANNLVVG